MTVDGSQVTDGSDLLQVRSRQDIEKEINRLLQSERSRLERQAGLREQPAGHFRRPIERPFTAAERDQVTILFGGLTWKHERLLKSVFQSAGYRVESLPAPDVEGFQIGKEYGNNGQCNPTYFTVGNLIKYLKELEASGMSRQEIIDNYVFFTAGCCGPCRFGMYEAEYRLGLKNAGFDGFRVLLFQQDQAINAPAGGAGLKFTVNFGMSALNALNFGDVMNDLACQIRPYEVNPGQTDRVFKDVMEQLAARMRDRESFEIEQRWPAWLSSSVARKKGVRDTFSVLGKIYDHLYGDQTIEALRECRDLISCIEVDRLRVKPVVKVTGEFWAQTTEGDGNFRMFAFLEREGAQVLVEPIGNWVMYLLWQARARSRKRKGLDTVRPQWWQLHRRLLNELTFRKKRLLFTLGERFYARQYRRVVRALGDTAHPLLDMDQVAELAEPYYNPLSRGGEGHLEVGKNIYYTLKKKTHMVMSLKPFGCMPSTQSDGVQSAVMSHFKDMIFLPIETSGEGAVNAHSRVQMTLGEAKAKAKSEFQQVLESTGKRLEDIKAYVAAYPELRRPFYPVPDRKGVTGTAANFVLHVSDLMDGTARLGRVPGPSDCDIRHTSTAGSLAAVVNSSATLDS